MKTPKVYTDNLKQKIITKEMLVCCLYSVNKRAKNYRDKEREYRERKRNGNNRYFNRYYYDKYDDEGKARKKKEEFYQKKEILLSVLKPVVIHKEQIGYEKERIYDYDSRYQKHLKKDDFVWENCFWSEEYEREVWFGDILKEDCPIYHYYLFYDIGAGKTFHTPINEEEVEKEKEKYGIEVVEIDQLDTHGEDIGELISCQFVDKVISLISSGDYKLNLEVS